MANKTQVMHSLQAHSKEKMKKIMMNKIKKIMMIVARIMKMSQ
jgi:hypothetical protein